MTANCPYCDAEMTCQFSETEDLDYLEEHKMTHWTVVELWKCYQCPGPKEE